MKNSLTIVLLITLIIFTTGVTTPQTFEWVKGIENTSVRGIATDEDGHIYITGHFWGTTSFGSVTLTSYGGWDIFLAKYDNEGNFLWARQTGGTSHEESHDIFIDINNNIYITGYFYETATFGSTTLVSLGDSEMFIAKFDNLGNCIWAKQSSGVSEVQGNSLSADLNGNVFVTGYFRGNATFGSTTLVCAGYTDLFIAKYDNSGNFLWVKQAGGETALTKGVDVVTDINGNCYVLGDFVGLITFGGTHQIYSAHFDSRDLFLAKYDNFGNFISVRQISYPGECNAGGIALDITGNIYVTGSMPFEFHFEESILITKLDSSFNLLWENQAGSVTIDRGHSIVIDDLGNCYLTGFFSGIATFGSTIIEDYGNGDIFVAAYNDAGNFLWVNKAGGLLNDYGNDIIIDKSKNLFVVGYSNGDATFGIHTLTNAGGIIAKINIHTPDIPLLASPDNNTIGVSLTPTLTWSAGPGGVPSNYRIQMTTDPSLQTFEIDEIVPTNTYTVISELQKNKVYYWRVKAINAAGTSPWSSTWKFTTTTANRPILSTPVNNTTIYSNTANLSWYLNGASTGLTWQIEFRETSEPLTGTATHSTAEGVFSLSVAGLIGSNSYHWSVRAYDNRSGVDIYSEWAIPFTFTVHVSVGAAPIPIVSWPISNAQIYTVTPTFSWYTNTYASGTLVYDIEIQPSGIPFTGIPTYSGLVNKTYTIPALDALTPGQQYHWQVRSRNTTTGINSNWSNVGEFRIFAGIAVTPVKPVISWPKGGTTVYTITPTLRWYLNAYANPGLEYEVELAEGNITSLTGVPNLFPGVNKFSIVTAALTKGSTYSWQVRSKTAGGAFSDWSTPQEFVVLYTGGSLPVPICSWPIGNAQVYGNSTILSWYLNAPFAGLSYDVELRQGNVGALTGTPTHTDIGVALFRLTIPTLLSGNQYSWQVRSRDGANVSNWSTPAIFQTYPGAGVGPAIPISSWPIGGATVYTNAPALNWYMNSVITGVTYDVRYSRYPGLSNAALFTNLGTTSFDLAGLISGTEYYWQVRAKDNNDIYSSWSTTALFVTAANNMLVIPSPASPYGLSLSNSSIEFSWYLPTLPEGEYTYELEIADNLQMNQPIIVYDINSSSITLNNLSGNKTYYWRVRSKDSNGYSAFSTEAMFWTENITSIEIEDGESIPEEFVVYQNYPNPFNPYTVISYSIPEDLFVTIKIFDMLGREVKTLLEKEVHTGKHSVAWNGKDNSGDIVTSGIYIYRVSAGENFKSMKLLFIK